MNLEELFDFRSFTHKKLLENTHNLWDPILELNSFLESFFSGKKGKLFVGHGAVVDPKAKIVGAAIIGKNCEIREGVLIREGVIIGDNCIIGHASEIKHSLILNNTNTAHFNYIGDSILGNNVNFAAGAITANFKHGVKNEIVNVILGGKKISTDMRKFGALIGDNAKIGCNSVLDPGTIIGKNTLIYPLASIRGTIPANKIVKHKQPIEIIDKK